MYVGRERFMAGLGFDFRVYMFCGSGFEGRGFGIEAKIASKTCLHELQCGVWPLGGDIST